MEVDSSNEKFSSAWKAKLEDVAGLQEAALQNKDAAWEKLHARLDKKPQRKRIILYRLAAASILAAITISLFTIHKTTTGIALQNNTSNNAKEPLTKKDEPVKNVSPKITNTEIKVPLQKNIVVKNDERKSITIETSNISQPVINDQLNLQSEAFTVPVAVDTTAIAASSSIPVQKKLKVVHVNELGELVDFPADIAHSTDLHLFQLKLAQQEIYNASSIASNNNSVLSLKPKNSSN